MDRPYKVKQALLLGASMRGSIEVSAILADEVHRLDEQIAEIVGSQRNEDKSLPTFEQVRNRIATLTEQNIKLQSALEDIGTLAHCIAKAGPLSTPDLATAWNKFDLISVKATAALSDRGKGPKQPEDNLRSCTICGLTVDISKGHIAPSADFSMRGRTTNKET